MKQISFGFYKNYTNSFGGSLLVGKRKSKRPLSTKNPIHLILKSNHKGVFAPGNISLEKLIFSQIKKFNIRIYQHAINWSHIHLVIKLHNQQDYKKFIRSITSIMAQKIRAKLQKTDKAYEKVFELRPFTRVLKWGRDFKITMSYQILNQLESLGMIKRVESATRKRRRVEVQDLGLVDHNIKP
jgi:REP element-mobilizing transposase RayT